MRAWHAGSFSFERRDKERPNEEGRRRFRNFENIEERRLTSQLKYVFSALPVPTRPARPCPPHPAFSTHSNKSHGACWFLYVVGKRALHLLAGPWVVTGAHLVVGARDVDVGWCLVEVRHRDRIIGFRPWGSFRARFLKFAHVTVPFTDITLLQSALGIPCIFVVD